MPRLYIGNLVEDCRPSDLEDALKSYIGVSDVSVKNGFGFVVSALVLSLAIAR